MIDINDIVLGISIIMLFWAISDFIYRHFVRHKRVSNISSDEPMNNEKIMTHGGTRPVSQIRRGYKCKDNSNKNKNKK
jgi:hypothetical protein